MGGECSTNVENRNVYRLLVRKSEGKSHWEDQDVGGWSILKWMGWIGLIWLRVGTSGGFL
jgi:hypothetical protein